MVRKTPDASLEWWPIGIYEGQRSAYRSNIVNYHTPWPTNFVRRSHQRSTVRLWNDDKWKFGTTSKSMFRYGTRSKTSHCSLIGVLHLPPQISMFCYTLKNNMHILYWKFFKELEKWHWNFSRPSDFYAVDQNGQNVVRINNLRTACLSYLKFGDILAEFIGQ